MTEVEAKQQLTKLCKICCTCGCKRRRVFYHEAGCTYRIAALPFPVTVRGSLYTEELPEAA